MSSVLEKGDAEDEMDGVTDSMDENLSKLPERVKDKEAWRAAVHGVAKNRTRLDDQRGEEAETDVCAEEQDLRRLQRVGSVCAGSTLSSTSGLPLREQLERQGEIHSSTEDKA